MDNVIINPGVGGAVVATDEVGGAQHQKIKMEFGDDGVATQVSQDNPMPVSTREQPNSSAVYCPNNSTSIAYEASRVAKASAGTLYSICGYNSNTTSQFIQIHNTISVPIDTAIPVVLLTIPAMSNFCYSADKFGRFFSTGITVCNSSTGPTKTIGAADIWFDIQYN